ncbi:hypothetical protein GCM10028813_14380 [Ramlibacter alkalitolerans]
MMPAAVRKAWLMVKPESSTSSMSQGEREGEDTGGTLNGRESSFPRRRESRAFGKKKSGQWPLSSGARGPRLRGDDGGSR